MVKVVILCPECNTHYIDDVEKSDTHTTCSGCGTQSSLSNFIKAKCEYFYYTNPYEVE